MKRQRLRTRFGRAAAKAGMSVSLVSVLAFAPLQAFAATTTDSNSSSGSTTSAASTGDGSNSSTLTQDQQRILEVYQYIHQYHVDPVDEDTLTNGAIQGMLEATGDPFSQYFTPEEYQQFIDDLNQTFVGIGIYLKQSGSDVIIDSTVADGPAAKAGLKAGDVIVSVNKQSLQGKKLDDVGKLLLGPVNTQVTIGIKRAGQTQPLTFTLTRQQIQLPVVVSRLTPEKLGYIQLFDFSETAADSFTKALQSLQAQGAKGIILDLRGNPGGVLQQAVQIADQFLQSGVILKTAESDGSSQTYTADGKGIATQIPLVILVNQDSASAAEALSGSLKLAHRATLIGTKTFGKGTMQVGIPLESGGVLKLTIGKYYFADGSNPHHVGIQPDLTIQNPDLQYNEAVQLLDPNRHQLLKYPLKAGQSFLNGLQVQAPVIKQVKGTTYVPLRYTLESFGIQVAWDSQTGSITCSSLGSQQASTVTLSRNGTSYQKGTQSHALKHPLLSQNGTSYISVDDVVNLFPLKETLANGWIQITQ